MTHGEVRDVIAQGIAEAAAVGLTKPVDVALSVQVQLDKAGLRVVRAPRPRQQQPTWRSR